MPALPHKKGNVTMIDPQMFMTRTEAAFAAYGNVVNPKLRALWVAWGSRSTPPWQTSRPTPGASSRPAQDQESTLGAQVYS